MLADAHISSLGYLCGKLKNQPEKGHQSRNDIYKYVISLQHLLSSPLIFNA